MLPGRTCGPLALVGLVVLGSFGDLMARWVDGVVGCHTIGCVVVDLHRLSAEHHQGVAAHLSLLCACERIHVRHDCIGHGQYSEFVTGDDGPRGQFEELDGAVYVPHWEESNCTLTPWPITCSKLVTVSENLRL